MDELKNKIKDFPTLPGVYLMKNNAGKIIYIGKAKSLKSRVRTYFQNTQDMTVKTKVLMSHVVEVEYLITKTEVEAFLLEASLIKKHKPKYNIRLKDDKSYPYIRFSSSDKFPRLYLSRHVKRDGSEYFGPYTSGLVVHETIRFLNRTFRIRDCTDSVFKTRHRPCLTYQIGRCAAPCVKYVTQEEYQHEISGALDFLKGKDKALIRELTANMTNAASQEKFEVAAKLRDSLSAIKAVLEKQSVVNANADLDQDIIGYYSDDRGGLIETLHVRQGKLIGQRPHFISGMIPEDVREWLVSFLNQYYENNIIPDEVLLPVDLGRDLTQLLEAVLIERRGRKVKVRFALDVNRRSLVQMAADNAKSHFEKYFSKSEEKNEGLLEIQKKLHLPEWPARIECFDISNFQGSEAVASQVVFENGLPAKEHYRRYKLKTVTQPDDYASLREVLSRRFAHTEYDEPQLIVIDGGKGQLNAAIKVRDELGFRHIPLVGLAKSRTERAYQKSEIEKTEERFFLPGRQNPVIFNPHSMAYHVLVGIRDEAHRFAITYHRKLREEGSLSSQLDMVVGLGEKRKRDLLRHYKSIDEIRASSVENIMKIKGFNRVLAERILLQLNENEDFSTSY